MSGQDHPRSRGVYKFSFGISTKRPGSSPLARGLRESAAVRGPDLRIIPARAGFTTSSPSSPQALPDHPRSRGVYAAFYGIVAQEAGIIPARAGFTSGTSAHNSPTRDHPRSRGVYSSRLSAITKKSGSSPLARGLPQKYLGWTGGSRIIPARAGFTMGYEVMRLVMRGSSPLARGLHSRLVVKRRSVRIIPARAGFTRPLESRLVDVQDHPRSRGVYASTVASVAIIHGSSPLARGLPGYLVEESALRRIIPARAGFTHTRCC